MAALAAFAAGDGIVIGVTRPAAADIGVSVGEVSKGPGIGSGAGGVIGAGARTMRRSFAPWGLCFHVKFKPGSPKVWPPNAMLNSSE